jgi:hypothetical protein
MELLICCALLGLIPAYVAQKKGRSFGLWWLYGALLFIVALPHALIMDPLPDSEAAMKHDALVRASKGFSPVSQTAVELTADRRGSGDLNTNKRGLSNPDHAQRPEKPEAPDRWRALTKYDSEIRAAVETLRPFGDAWVDKLGRDFFALNEDKSYLPNMVQTLKDEAERYDREEWSVQFRHTADGELCSEESMSVLRKARVSGYALSIQSDGAFVLQNNTTTRYLRSNNQIRQLGQSLPDQSPNNAS